MDIRKTPEAEPGRANVNPKARTGKLGQFLLVFAGGLLGSGVTQAGQYFLLKPEIDAMRATVSDQASDLSDKADSLSSDINSTKTEFSDEVDDAINDGLDDAKETIGDEVRAIFCEQFPLGEGCPKPESESSSTPEGEVAAPIESSTTTTAITDVEITP